MKVWLARRVPVLLVISLGRKGLTDTGWVRSAATGRLPVDRDGQPLPWLTEAAIHLLDDRVPSSARVFEFGAGNSTLWWAARVTEVVAAEHDPVWAARIERGTGSNVRVLRRPLDAGYTDAVVGLGRFEVITVDGGRRADCARAAVGALSTDGVLIWDDTDLEADTEVLDEVVGRGFRRLDLWGLHHAITRLSCTTILYRDGNCLGV